MDHFSMDEAGFLNFMHIGGTHEGHSPGDGRGPPPPGGQGGPPGPGGGGGGSHDNSWKTPWDTSQSGINSLICNIMRSRDDHVPAACDYKYLGDSSNPIQTSWGIASTGTLLFNGISGEGVDPFYPAAYNGNCQNPDDCVEKIDQCLVHPNPNAGQLHYHAAGTCQADASISNSGEGSSIDIISAIQNTWGKKRPYREVVGLSKDGRPIYSPFYSNGRAYSGCDVDICNGMEIEGNYAYVTTQFHPFIMGCYGPGATGELPRQQCSSKPRTCGKGAIYMAVSTFGTIAALIVSSIY